jgi:hypothetical protein
MGGFVQYFGKNAMGWSQKSAFVLLMALALVFSAGCSRKMPCPDVAKATAKAKKQKKNKVVKAKKVVADEGGEDSEIATEEAPADETATASTEKKPTLSTKRNKYSKNGLLQKKKYKRLRSNPGKKSYRQVNFFTRLFGGGGKSKTKSKTRRTQNVQPVDE